jgi:hypothetical protein
MADASERIAAWACRLTIIPSAQEAAMERGANARYGAATGILAVILTVVGFAIFGSDIPDADGTAQQWQSFFVDHQNRIQTGLTIIGIGLFFFIWFLGSLRDAIASVEVGRGRLASIAFGGGLVAVAALVTGVTGYLTAAFHPQELGAPTTRALSDFGALVAAPAAAGLTALFAATAVAGYRHGALPAPIAGISATAAIGQLFAYPTGVTDSGAFAPDGFLGLWVPFVTFAIAVLAISGTLVARAGAGAPAARATPAP